MNNEYDNTCASFTQQFTRRSHMTLTCSTNISLPMIPVSLRFWGIRLVWDIMIPSNPERELYIRIWRTTSWRLSQPSHTPPLLMSEFWQETDGVQCGYLKSLKGTIYKYVSWNREDIKKWSRYLSRTEQLELPVLRQNLKRVTEEREDHLLKDVAFS